MKKYMLSPSIFVGNLLNLESDIRQLDEAGVDMLHVDMADTTFAKYTAIPNAMIPLIREITTTPLDIHIASEVPETYFPTILPYCKDSFVSIHIETTKEFNSLAYEVRKAGGRPGVAINCSTPACLIKEVLPMVDMVLVMICDTGRDMHIPGLKDIVYPKVTEIKKMCNDAKMEDMIIQCDAGITFEMAKTLLNLGANSLVLGRDSIFAQRSSLGNRVKALRDYLK